MSTHLTSRTTLPRLHPRFSPLSSILQSLSWAIIAMCLASIACSALFWKASPSLPSAADVAATLPAQAKVEPSQVSRTDYPGHFAPSGTSHPSPLWLRGIAGGFGYDHSRLDIAYGHSADSVDDVAAMFTADGWRTKKVRDGFIAHKDGLQVYTSAPNDRVTELIATRHTGWLWHACAWGIPLLVAAALVAFFALARPQIDPIVVALTSFLIAPFALANVIMTLTSAIADPMARAQQYFATPFDWGFIGTIPRAALLVVLGRLVWIAAPRLRRPLVYAMAFAPMLLIAFFGVFAEVAAASVDVDQALWRSWRHGSSAGSSFETEYFASWAGLEKAGLASVVGCADMTLRFVVELFGIGLLIAATSLASTTKWISGKVVMVAWLLFVAVWMWVEFASFGIYWLDYLAE